MGLPKPVGSVPEPEYLKPGFLATPPPNLGMAQAMAKAQAMAAQPKAMPSSAMLQAMQATVQAAAAAAKGAIPQPSVAMVGQQLTAYPSAVQDRVRDYASVKLMTTATPEQRFAINKRLVRVSRLREICMIHTIIPCSTLPTPVAATTDIANKLKEVEENMKRKAEEARMAAMAASAAAKKSLTSQMMKKQLQSYKVCSLRMVTNLQSVA